jgi:hypothetical protein
MFRSWFVFRGKLRLGSKANSCCPLPILCRLSSGFAAWQNKFRQRWKGGTTQDVLQDLSVPLREGALYIKNVDGDKDADGKVISYFPVARGIKTHRYTMSLTIDRQTKELKEVQLFDDEKDPYQMHNLPWQENKETVAELSRLIVPLLKEADDPWYREKILNDLIPY